MITIRKGIAMYTTHAYQRGMIYKNIALMALVIVVIGTILKFTLGLNHIVVEYILFTATPTLVTAGLFWVVYARIGYYLTLIVSVLLIKGFMTRISVLDPVEAEDYLAIYFGIVLVGVGFLYAIYGSKIMQLTFTKIKLIY